MLYITLYIIKYESYIYAIAYIPYTVNNKHPIIKHSNCISSNTYALLKVYLTVQGMLIYVTFITLITSRYNDVRV